MIQSYLLKITMSLILVSSIIHAKQDLLEELLEISGTTQLIEQVPEAMVTGWQGAMSEDSKNDLNKTKIEEIIRSSFDIKKIKQEVLIKTKISISEKEAQNLLVWYKSDFGKKVTQAENKLNNPAAYSKMMQEAEVLFQDKERIHYAQLIDGLTDSTYLMVEFQKNTLKSTLQAVSTLSELDNAMSEEQVSIFIASQEEMLQKAMH